MKQLPQSRRAERSPQWRRRFSKLLRRWAERIGRARLVEVPNAAERECPICGFRGRFTPFGLYNIRPDARCGRCQSFERERQLFLHLSRARDLPSRPRILHFAPEPAIGSKLAEIAKTYVTADLNRPDVDVNWNIEAIDAEDSGFDMIVCSHVLEHVDAQRALRECHRVLKPSGVAFFMVPICEGLERTYENATAAQAGDDERWRHFQQSDHVRIFGRDFRDMIRSAGFSLEESVANGEEAVRYGLVMGERIFIARPL